MAENVLVEGPPTEEELLSRKKRVEELSKRAKQIEEDKNLAKAMKIENIEELEEQAKSRSILQAIDHFIEQTANYLESIGSEDPPTASKLKRYLKAPLRKLGQWLNKPPKERPSDYETLSALKKLQYQVSKMTATRNRKVAALLIGFLLLLGALITIIKLHDHYHVIEKEKHEKHEKLKKHYLNNIRR